MTTPAPAHVSKRYFPGAIVFLPPDGTFGDLARCIDFKAVAPPGREPHVVLRFDGPFLERDDDGTLHPLASEVDHLTLHAGLRVHLTDDRGGGARRVLHRDQPLDDRRPHHLLLVGLPLPTCPPGSRDGQRTFHGAAIIPYGDPSGGTRVLIDVWGANSRDAFTGWHPVQPPVAGARPAFCRSGEPVEMFEMSGPPGLCLAFSAWEALLVEGEDPRPWIARALCECR